jgi:hypothetical protein
MRSTAIVLLAALAFLPLANAQTGPPQDNNAQAKAILDQMIQALGGSAYLNVQDMQQAGRTYTLSHGQSTGPGVLFWRFTKFPDKERIELTKQRDIAYVYRGDHAYEITYKGTAEQEPKLVAEYLRRRDHSLEWVIRRWINEPGVALLYEGSAIAGDKPTQKVSIINSKNDSVTLFIDSNTHLPIKKSYSWRDPADNLRNTEDELFDAYRPTQGIMTPYSITRFYNGEMTNQRFLNTVAYNQNVSDTMFDATTSYDPARLPTKKK